MEFKLTYGLRNNELLTIDEVESGLSCNCVCPACNKRLIARKGDVNAHHFAHYKSEDCLSGLETVLHKISKELLLVNKVFKTPILFYPNTHYEIFEEREIIIDNVKLEKKIGEFIPDVIIESKGKKLLLEIVVTNSVSWQKLQRIKSENLPIIEINVKYILQSLYTKKDFKLEGNLFKNELLYGTKYKRWLHNPKINSIKQNLKDNYAELKKVKFFKRNHHDFYYVENCPLEKKFWKGGKNIGKPYASVEQNCKSCEFCVLLEKKKNLIGSTGYYEITPEAVHCLGYLKNDFRELIKQIK